MASSIYRRYMWLVRTISQQRVGLAFDEINERWQHSTLNDDGRALSKRTFRNWVNAIGENLGIYIECTKRAPFAFRAPFLAMAKPKQACLWRACSRSAIQASLIALA